MLEPKGKLMNWHRCILTHEHSLESVFFRVCPLLITNSSNKVINLSIATKDNRGKHTFSIPVSMPTTSCREISSGARWIESPLVLLQRPIKPLDSPSQVPNNHKNTDIHSNQSRKWSCQTHGQDYNHHSPRVLTLL